MASSPEHRGDSVRITWLLGGNGPKQSCTFTGPYEARLKLALAAKELVEARRHNITRRECYEAILGAPAPTDTVVPTFAMWAQQWLTELLDKGQLPAATVDRYEQVLRNRVIPYLGHCRITDINEQDITDCRSASARQWPWRAAAAAGCG
jgi:hypothetical protein